MFLCQYDNFHKFAYLNVNLCQKTQNNIYVTTGWTILSFLPNDWKSIAILGFPVLSFWNEKGIVYSPHNESITDCCWLRAILIQSSIIGNNILLEIENPCKLHLSSRRMHILNIPFTTNNFKPAQIHSVMQAINPSSAFSNMEKLFELYDTV